MNGEGGMVIMPGQLLERGWYCYGTRRLYSTLKDCVLQRKLLRTVDWTVFPLCCATRRYTSVVAQNASETSDNNEVSTSIKYWENFQPFPSMIEMRRREARRSIIVEVSGKPSGADLVNYCNTIGLTRNAFSYTANDKNYVLIEFSAEESKEEALKIAAHSQGSKIVPVTSAYLWFRQSKDELKNNIFEKSAIQTVAQDILVSDENEVIKELQNCKTMVDQINILYDKYKVSDLSTRLRFLTCNQLERAISGVFPHARAFPFGSSVSGFGRNSADLDIFLEFHCSNKTMPYSKARLIFHSKYWRDDSNLQLKLIGDLISVALPGCTNVRSIMGARVPIIKYQHSITNMECDVQISSASGVDMTHLLWIMCCWDKRVAPLVYTLRYWAKVNNVTHDTKPSPFITNFNLIILIIFFLQVENVLPTLKFLEKTANPRTSVQYDNSLQKNFLQDIRQLPEGLWTVHSKPTVDTLLLKFFEFYSNFSFESKSISLIDGQANFKPDSRAMYVVNPLLPSLNITRNVNREGVSMFQRMVRDSHSRLVKEMNSQSSLGLLSLIPGYKKIINSHALSAAITSDLSENGRLNTKKLPSNKTVTDASSKNANMSKSMRSLGREKSKTGLRNKH